MARAFAADLQRRTYSDEPRIEMRGDCPWKPTDAGAGDYMTTIKRNLVARGMTTFGLFCTPAVAH